MLTYNTYDAEFNRLHEKARRNQMRAFQIDLTVPHQVSELGKYIKRINDSASIIDLSNIAQYKGQGFLTEFALNFSNYTTNDSLLLTTTAGGDEGFTFRLSEPWNRDFSYKVQPLNGCNAILSK
ncbi:MAG: hypothetical protein H6625_03305 [Bdellovibrionaceae bacterium]|nr:hypothetical protein [Pseudobdellovibrionaceae bacterium]